MALLQVKVAGIDGSEWTIRTTGPVARGVMLETPSGLVSNPERTSSPRSTGRGVRVGGWAFPEMTGSLGLRIFPDRVTGMSLGEVYDGFLDALSTTEEFDVLVVDGRGIQWHTGGALMTNEPDPPATSPHTVGLRDVELDLPITVPGGIFTRETVWKSPDTGGAVRVANRGNLAAFPVLRWPGDPVTVRGPYGDISLPRAPGWRRLSTDPGTGFKITDDAGATDSDTWSSMRGRAAPGELAPRGSAEWVLPAGVELILAEYRTNVWR